MERTPRLRSSETDPSDSVMECIIETKASTLLEFIRGLRGDLHVTLEEGTWATWLYDLLKPHVTEVVVCNPKKQKNDRKALTLTGLLMEGVVPRIGKRNS